MKKQDDISNLFGELSCITCNHVLSSGDVNFISHSGGDWIVLCGDESHFNNEFDNMTAVHFSHLLEMNPYLINFSNIPINTAVIRSGADAEWKYISDVDDEYCPVAGDVVSMSDDELNLFFSALFDGSVYYMIDNNNYYASVVFDTGLRVIPVWSSAISVESAGRGRWPNDEIKYEKIDVVLDKIMNQLGNDFWVCVDFLKDNIFHVVTVGELLAVSAQQKNA